MCIKNKKALVVFISLIVLCFGCDGLLPDDLDVIDDDTQFTRKTYNPVLGRNTLMGNNFNPANSTRPFTFKILNFKTVDGDSATELTQNFPVRVWTKPYFGNETSLQEIENKRAIEFRPLFSIREHSGEFVMWAGANSSFVRCAPDSSYVFDVEVQNTGGRRYFKNFKLIPSRERPYEPSLYDPVYGIAQNSFSRPLSINNVVGDSTGLEIREEDVKIFFNKNENEESFDNTVTFKFFDRQYRSINPQNFNLTGWASLIHGFDLDLTSEYVRYKVAFPIPLIELETQYTNPSGNMARVNFAYDRLNIGGFRIQASLMFDFAIYEEGNWEIIVVFENEGPQFEND